MNALECEVLSILDQAEAPMRNRQVYDASEIAINTTEISRAVYALRKAGYVSQDGEWKPDKGKPAATHVITEDGRAALDREKLAADIEAKLTQRTPKLSASEAAIALRQRVMEAEGAEDQFAVPQVPTLDPTPAVPDAQPKPQPEPPAARPALRVIASDLERELAAVDLHAPRLQDPTLPADVLQIAQKLAERLPVASERLRQAAKALQELAA